MQDSSSTDLTSETVEHGDSSAAPSRSNSTEQGGSAHFDQKQAMDPQVTTIQPGGGVVMSIELAWGGFRRKLLRSLRPGYVAKMERSRQGHRGNLPFEPVDSRDMKYYQNQDSYWWADADDPFQWRNSLPFVRAGLAELILIGGGFLFLAILMGLIHPVLALPGLVVCGLVVWFFRDPPRRVPDEQGVVVSPADGKLVQVESIEDPEIGKAIQVGIFLSIFNVHANRASLPGKVKSIRYRPGKMLNALRPESAKENENLDLVLEDTEGSGRIFRIRQITGQFARRIVCWVRPGDVLQRGEMYGMIKLGSRTEIILPDDGTLKITAAIGEKLKAGSSVLGKYGNAESTPPQG